MESNDLLSLSSIDSDENIKTIVLNDKEKEIHFELVQGDNTYCLSIPSRSILTIILENH